MSGEGGNLMTKPETSVADKEKVAEDNLEDVILADTRGWRRWLTTFASLRNRNFRLFAIGMLFSFTALQIYLSVHQTDK